MNSLIPENIDDLNPDQLRKLYDRLEQRYQERRPGASTADDVAALRLIREAQADIAARVEAMATGTAEALTELDGAPALEPEAVAEVVEEVEVVDAGAEVVAEAEAVIDASSAELTAVAAARGAGSASPEVVRSRPQVGFVATAGQSVALAGSDIDLDTVGRMIDAVKDTRVTETQRVYVAAIPGFDQTEGLGVDMLSMDTGAWGSTRLIHESIAAWRDQKAGKTLDARTAAICTPLDILREIPDCTSDADPMEGLFPSRPAGRLGFQYIPSMSLDDIDGAGANPWVFDATAAVNPWNDAKQAAVLPNDPTTWKPCIPITCPTVQSCTATAIVACIYFDITTEMSAPERIADAMKKLAALRTRRRTQYLLGLIDAVAADYTFDSKAVAGTFNAVINAVGNLLPQLAYSERLDSANYELLLEPGLVDKLVMDLNNRGMCCDQVSKATAVTMLEQALGIGVRPLLDKQGAGLAVPAAGAIPPLPQADKMYLVAPEGALYFSTGEQATGVERSPELMRRNQAQWFSEEFIGLCKVGCHPWATITVTSCANGARAGLYQPVCP